MAVQEGGKARQALPRVAKEVDAVIDFCAGVQLGMPYAEHAARLTVGAAVTWSLINSSPPDKAGTIVEVLEDGNLLVEGASSGKRGRFLPANLRLA